MCYNCGCEAPDDDMGHPDNITNHTFHHLAEKMGKPEDETKRMVLMALEEDTVEQNPDLVQMFAKAAAEGQTVEEAKKETLRLLKKVLG